ncbi:MAG: SAM-dependent methyltransferase [Defluviitaleaceae bacterium]|nr:SAM-dependent methyltransferase [Defluviitaleaceae bacterium]
MKKIEIAIPVSVLEIIVSNPNTHGAADFTRVNIKRTATGFQAEKLTKTQAFHDNFTIHKLNEYLSGLLSSGFRQINAFDGDGTEYTARLTKSGELLTGKKRSERKISPNTEHDKEKRYIIPPNADIPILRDIGLVTSTGQIAANMGDKFRQINRFLEIISDVCRDDLRSPLRIIDFGCGKSYLTFLLYHYFTQIREIECEITGLDLKSDVINNCNKLAVKYGYTGLRFKLGNIAEYTNFTADMLISLHACDTATDYAIYNAVKCGVGKILVAPCCQHELNGQIKTDDFAVLTHHGLLKERAAAVMTDAIRANLLIYAGYKTQVLEFIDTSHTAKNLMIRAVKAKIPKDVQNKALNEIKHLTKEFNLSPTLLKLFNHG